LVQPLSTSLSIMLTSLLGDISRQDVDAIVNAANPELGGGSGVNGAIRRAGGPEIQEYCQKIRATTHPKGLSVGQSVITRGGKLQAKWIIHTVGPKYGQHDGKEAELLASCYRTALELAESHKLKSIAFPAISTGVYFYPEDEAAAVSSRAVRDKLPSLKSVQEIRFVFFSEDSLRKFKENSVLEG
jgi:O-acetyl-ADP-ribose deacetylase (regulator of RNase III)